MGDVCAARAKRSRAAMHSARDMTAHAERDDDGTYDSECDDDDDDEDDEDDENSGDSSRSESEHPVHARVRRAFRACVNEEAKQRAAKHAPRPTVRAKQRARVASAPDASSSSSSGEWVSDYVIVAHRHAPAKLYLVPDPAYAARTLLPPSDFHQVHLFEYRANAPLGDHASAAIAIARSSSSHAETACAASAASTNSDARCDASASRTRTAYRILARQVQELFGLRNTGINWDAPGMGGSDVDTCTTFWRTARKPQPHVIMRRGCKHIVKTTEQMCAFDAGLGAFRVTGTKMLAPECQSARAFVHALACLMRSDTGTSTSADAVGARNPSGSGSNGHSEAHITCTNINTVLALHT